MKRSFRIHGRPNIVLAGHTISGQANNNGNDGTVARFGWKARQVSPAVLRRGVHVEMGITNELFQTERDETPTCQFDTVPNDVTKTDGKQPLDAISAIEKFAFFARFLAHRYLRPIGQGGPSPLEEGETCSAVRLRAPVIRRRYRCGEEAREEGKLRSH